MANLETRKKSRCAIRSSFTKTANELSAEFGARSLDCESIDITWELLKTRYDGLRVLDSEIYELLLESATEDQLQSEIETSDSYIRKFTALRLKYDKLVTAEDPQDSVSSRSNRARATEENVNTGMRSFKLPRIEFKHYDGSIKGWLSFWAQFKKIHEDSSIDEHDKIEYLIQATIPGSRARQLVESYPAMSENYNKIINSMFSRFGREDLQIEVYVRELLKLILSNSTSRHGFDIATLYDKIETQLRALETLGITSDKCSAMLYPLIESCLSNDLLRVWQRSINFNSSLTSEEGKPSSSLEIRLKNLMTFLRQEVENEQRINLATEGFGISSKENNVKDRKIVRERDRIPSATELLNQSAVGTCIFCTGDHTSESCFKAKKMTYDQKKAVISEKRACFRCLKPGHLAKRCRGRLRCAVCGRSHVVLMCPGVLGNRGDSESPNGNKDKEDTVKDQTLANQSSTPVFLQTLRVTLKGRNGHKTVRVLIDSGSQRSYILKNTAMQLGYTPKRSEKIMHCLFGGKEMVNTHNCYDVSICHGNGAYIFEVLDQLTICGDVTPVFYGSWTEEMRALNIDVSDNQNPGPIELLLGADIVGKLYTGKRCELPCGLVAMETHLGWTLMGKMPTKGLTSGVVQTTLNLLVKDASISDLWELEAIGIQAPTDKKTKGEREIAAEELFLQTVTVNQERRYEVRLPWLEGHSPLPNNYKLAQKRLSSTVRKLKLEGLYEQYENVFAEWKTEGIIEEVGISEHEDVTQGHYLPHRPVLKESSTTTKIRPVFDASAHEKDKPALNHCLEKGPNLIELIPSILLRFREKKIGVVSDIRKAFLQISVNEQDRNFLRFLWINEQQQEVILRHKRVVFGVNSSPFLLGATLEFHLSKSLEDCPATDVYTQQVIQKLSKSFYVDNCVMSLPEDEQVEQFIQKAKSIMSEGQFDLCGWEYTRDDTDHVCNTCPVLGLTWCPQKDVLTLSQEFIKDDLDIDNMVVTKRQILSVAQKIFDPIGYLCPAVLIPKLILQKLWTEKLTWDQPVDDVTAQSFKTWLEQLPYLMKIEIPRWMGISAVASQNLSLHTFCDASKDAYACVIFLRVASPKKVSVFLLAGKARVAPLRNSNSKMTIPRLELLAATIGARLYNQVITKLECKPDCFFWTDSSTVVSWIQRTDEWGVFVWNRFTEIRDLTAAEKWHHLPGIYNPADLPSRGCSPEQLFKSRWWEGPEWLYNSPEAWPCVNTKFDEMEIDAERKKKLVTTLLNTSDCSDWHLDYFSIYSKTIRMIAWIFRFTYNCRHVKQKRFGELTMEEYSVAENFVLKRVQQEVFSDDEHKKKISSLHPFVAEDGLIRLKSRVSNRVDTEDFRFPILLPAQHHVVKCLIMYMHRNSCHAGPQTLLSLLREHFWILGGRRTVRSVISKCTVCRRHEIKPFAVESPPLPLDRVREAVGFEITGVDFAGPLYLKGGEKIWICLFTCAVYRAVHLELTMSMSTSSFLQALRRFVSRRGRPRIIYSDNGTNFIGAENAFSQLDWDKIVQRINWRFNPPTAAWWGGFWERLIGVVKRLLRKVLGKASLDYEDLLTLLCDCAAIINARPLTYVSDDSRDLVALSPVMFLRDQVDGGVPDCDTIDRESLCRKLRKMQSFRDGLRARFRAEYLGQLKLMCAKKSDSCIAVGDLVLIGNDNSRRLNWPVGRVVELLPGKDQKIRLVRVETIRGQLLRPVQRLYPLECCNEPELPLEIRNLNQHQSRETSDPPEDASASGPISNQREGRVPIEVKKTRCGRICRVPRRYS